MKRESKWFLVALLIEVSYMAFYLFTVRRNLNTVSHPPTAVSKMQPNPPALSVSKMPEPLFSPVPPRPALPVRTTTIRRRPVIWPVTPPATPERERQGWALPIPYNTAEVRYNLLINLDPRLPLTVGNHWNEAAVTAFHETCMIVGGNVSLRVWRIREGVVTLLTTLSVNVTKAYLTAPLQNVQKGDLVIVENHPALLRWSLNGQPTCVMASMVDTKSNDPSTMYSAPITFNSR